MITSYDKSEVDDKIFNDNLERDMKAYKKFKKWFKFSAATAGVIIFSIYILLIENVAEYEYENKLRFVRMYFDTPTFDRITKDRAAKFVDMLSAIGGTMGLLTGFSIISAVEIIYFSTKIIIKVCFKNKTNVF